MKDGCPFCDYEGPSEVLYETDAAFIIEPLRQVTAGHVLAVPRAHATDFADDALAAMAAIEIAHRWWRYEEIKAQRRDGFYHPLDCNLITSKGRSATQTVFHLHLHILPRRPGDGLTLPWANPNG